MLDTSNAALYMHPVLCASPPDLGAPKSDHVGCASQP
jgi:hypothetical protein